MRLLLAEGLAMRKRVALFQFPCGHMGVLVNRDPDFDALLSGELNSTVYDGAVISAVKGGRGDPWLRVEVYREEK